MTATHVRTRAKRYENGQHTGPGEWLDLIHECNRIVPETFGASTPDSGDWWAGGYAEEYEDARVIHRADGTVSVVSKTNAGARLLAVAAENLDMLSINTDAACLPALPKGIAVSAKITVYDDGTVFVAADEFAGSLILSATPKARKQIADAFTTARAAGTVAPAA